MVDIGTQTVSDFEINSQDLSVSKNNKSVLTVMNKTQIETVDLHSQVANIINFDRAIVSIGRSDDSQRLRSSDESYISNYCCATHSNDQQQINVVDQMIAQPQLPYILLPKHFKLKQISTDQNSQKSSLLVGKDDASRHSQQQNYAQDNDSEHELMIHRRFAFTNSYYDPHKRDYYNSYSYRSAQHRSHLPFNAISSQDFYAQSQQQFYEFSHRRNNSGCILDDHRINTSKRQSRNDIRAKTYKTNNNNY